MTRSRKRSMTNFGRRSVLRLYAAAGTGLGVSRLNRAAVQEATACATTAAHSGTYLSAGPDQGKTPLALTSLF